MNTIKTTAEEKLELKKAKSVHKAGLALPNFKKLQERFFHNFVTETMTNDKGKSYERPRRMPNWNSLNFRLM